MGFNYRKEEYKLKKHQEAQRKFFKSNGMTDDQIAAIEEMEWNDFRYRRNQESEGTTVPLMIEGEDGFEHEYDPIAMSYEEDVCGDPFEFGFDDPRLNAILARADETDLKILRMFSEGKRQSEIARALGLSEKAISKRVAKYRK